jgi:hypothetical protein
MGTTGISITIRRHALNTQSRVAPLSDPESAFLEPRFVVENKALSHSQKIKLLLDWRQDLLEQQTASEENMPRQRGEANVSEKLTAVTNALVALGYESA